MDIPAPEPLAVASLTDLADIMGASEGFADVVAALREGKSATIDGAWGSSCALAVSALAKSAPAPILVTLAHPADVDNWLDDLAHFTGFGAEVFLAWDRLPQSAASHQANGLAEEIDEVAASRLRLLKTLQSSSPPRLIIATIQALIQPVPDQRELTRVSWPIRIGTVVPPEELAAWLVQHGFHWSDAVVLPGQFCRRGGIVDVFPPDADFPYRIEFFGDEIDSIRQFSPQSQRSTGECQAAELTGLSAGLALSNARGHLCDYLPANSWTILVEPDDLLEQAQQYHERASQSGLFSTEAVFKQLFRFPSVRLSAFPIASMETTCHLRIESVERFSGNISKLQEELTAATSGERVVIACHNEAEKERLAAVLATAPKNIQLVVGQIHAGFRMVDRRLVVLGDHEIFHRQDLQAVRPRRRVETRAIDSFLELAEGDLVVHVSHGIARYRGMEVVTKHGRHEEHLILEFRGGTRVYVPASKINLVQKYVGGSRTEPELSRFGGRSWQKRKDRVEKAVMDLAVEMVELQAKRESQPGHAFPPDSEWQLQFEAAFPYEETPDQLTTMAEIKQDMMRVRPMDRLVCGDVGYGKTELAIRAAFKAVDNGKQVAVLVPTTILAEQHFRTFSQRLAEFPFVVEVLSRFRTHAEQKRIIERLARGAVDIIIGTHRLLSSDIKFRDLGLVIIDEEQRFGVDHKERLKHLREMVDVLTLTATPIPRTLHLSLLGIRDISNLETPPPDRLAIETRIVRYDPQLIRHAILRELNREGQVYFVHNRVQSIFEVADKLQEIVPEARISVAHGQMAEKELEQAMLRFLRRESDILVATTIIESGLDIPNANTIFIDQADRYGLADLHQLRGRVGRYKHRAYAYLLLDRERSLTPIAARRLKALEEFTELGAGFKIALRDLEIRGAGNILGTQQSGHIAAVGYELYCQLLEQAAKKVKNQPVRTRLEVNIDLPYVAYLPHDYVPGQKQRIEIYRRLGRIARTERLEEFRQELRDRFGPLPEPAQWLVRLAELRLLAARWQVANVHLECHGSKADLVLGYRSRRLINKLAERSGGRLRVVDAKSAYYRLKPHETSSDRLFACLQELLRYPTRHGTAAPSR
ncbi:MAG: transcription-repair-coupling factor [Gemmatales bacterium]|nr:MAG: transcription-repair-coupling factor [Gemmatales bacterium]